LRRFYANELIAVAEKLRSSGYEGISLGRDENVGTWYVDVDAESAVFIEVEVEQVTARLRGIWEGEDLQELAALSASLVEVARDLRTDEDESADISPFMYVMY
jgi:hypothetical protein